MQKGSCACGGSRRGPANPGAVTYELDDDTKKAGLCYCRDCNKTSSGGCVPTPSPSFSPLASDPSALVLRIDKDKLHVKGDAKFWATSQTASGKEARRYFCPGCGAHLWVECDAYPQIVTAKVCQGDAELTSGRHAGRLRGRDPRDGGQHAQCDQVVPACQGRGSAAHPVGCRL